MPFYSSQSFSESRLFSPSLMQSRLPINPSPSFLQSGLPPSDFTGKKFYIKVFFYQNSSFMFHFVLMYSKKLYFYREPKNVFCYNTFVLPPVLSMRKKGTISHRQATGHPPLPFDTPVPTHRFDELQNPT